jgi:hypothetical protein
MTKSTKWMVVISGLFLALALGMLLGGQTVQQVVSAQSPDSGDGHSLDAADGDPTDAVFVDNNGNVGIRTLNPKATFDIGGHVNVQDGNNAGVMYFPQSGNLPNLYIRSDDDPSTYEEASERLFVGGNGNVGIGTIEPAAKLHIKGETNYLQGLRIENPEGRSTMELFGRVSEDPTLNTQVAEILLSGYNPLNSQEVRRWSLLHEGGTENSLDPARISAFSIGNNVEGTDVYRHPFTIEFDAPTDSLRIDAAGNIGISGNIVPLNPDGEICIGSGCP